MSVVFTTTSTMEFDDREDFEALVQQMPWSPEEKEAFLESGSHEEDDEVEIDGAGDVTHKFTW